MDALYQVMIDDAGKGLFDTVSTMLFALHTVNRDILDRRDGPRT